MRSGKNGNKNVCFFRGGARAETDKKLFQNIGFVLQKKLLPIPVFLADLVWELKVFFLLKA